MLTTCNILPCQLTTVVQIDHLYTHNVCQADVTTEVIDCYYSDHDIVACAIDVKHDIC